MGCGGCVKTVEHKLSTLPDVASVKVDLEKKQAEITSSQLLKINKLQKGLDNTNYTIAELGLNSVLNSANSETDGWALAVLTKLFKIKK